MKLIFFFFFLMKAIKHMAGFNIFPLGREAAVSWGNVYF